MLQKAAPLALALVILAGCGAPKRITLPEGAGQPFPEFAAAYEAATASCRAVTTITAALGLSGRAGGTKLRGRIDAGFAAPASLRLEGVAPFGKPVFVLAGTGQQATLVLPRDARVLRDAAPAEIIHALAGIALDPDQLRRVLAGCGLASEGPTSGRQYANGWARVDAGDAVTYLRRGDAAWRVVAATRGTLAVEYAEHAAAHPASVRIRMSEASGRVEADLVLRLSQVELNVPLGPEVFEVEVPRDATPLTLEELRRAGPLGRGER